MSRYLTSYASPYIPYVPYKPSRSDRVGLDSIQVLNNRPSLNEELELDEDRDEESAKISAVMPIYRAQDIKTTDQS